MEEKRRDLMMHEVEDVAENLIQGEICVRQSH